MAGTVTSTGVAQGVAQWVSQGVAQGYHRGTSLAHSLARLGCNFIQPVDLYSLWICTVLVIYTGAGRGNRTVNFYSTPPDLQKVNFKQRLNSNAINDLKNKLI